MKRTTFHIVVVVVVVVESMTTHPYCCHPIGASSIDTSHSKRELNRRVWYKNYNPYVDSNLDCSITPHRGNRQKHPHPSQLGRGQSRFSPPPPAAAVAVAKDLSTGICSFRMNKW